MIRNIIQKITGANTTKMVIIVRTDIGMGRGKIAAQVAHAAVSLYQSSVTSSNPHLSTWLRWGQPKVILKVDTDCYATLEAAYQKAIDHKLNACLIHDAGRTQIQKGILTAIGIGPNKTEEIDEITGSFKLL